MSEEQLIKTPSMFGENGNILLERELGRGGMGGVYMGRDKMLDRPVAVKVMLREYGADAEFVEKFKREAQAAAKLIHPNIAQIYTYGISDGMPYIAMELVAGGSLDQLMQNAGASIEIPRVMKICEQVAQALRCAADRGLVHGDVKPENILLDADGNAKLVDFGLAAMQKNTDEIWGTPYYIAPEKVKKEPVDYRADIYSLGGTIYHALTGVAPFEGDDTASVVRKRFEAPPVPPSRIRPDVSPMIDALVLKMLALDPAERYPSFEALLEDFRRVMTTGLTVGGAGTVANMVPGGQPTGRRLVLKNRARPRTAGSSDEGGASSQGSAGRRAASSDTADQGGVAGKVAAVIGATLAVIGLVAGLLFWYVVADRRSRAREEQTQLAGQFEKARTSLADTRQKALGYADEFDEKVAKAADKCQKATDDLTRTLSEFDKATVARIKPGPTPELVKAIALTNAGASASAPAPAPAGDVSDQTLASAIRDMNDLWNRVYNAQAAAIRLRLDVQALVKKIDDYKVGGSDKGALDAVAAFSNEAKAAYEALRNNADYDKAKNALGVIDTKGTKTVTDAAERLNAAKRREARDAAAAAAAAAEDERQKALEQIKRDTIKRDNETVQKKFDSLVETGVFRQLNWSGAISQLRNVSDEFKYAESQTFAECLVKRVQMMATVQEVFILNCKDYKFTRSKLAGCTVTEINEKEIRLLKADGSKTPMRLNWATFYKDYHGNLNELVSRFIVRGKDTSSYRDGKRLGLQPWADAMLGASLTIKLVCNDGNSAETRAEQIATEAVKAMPGYEKYVKDLFPNTDFKGSDD